MKKVIVLVAFMLTATFSFAQNGRTTRTSSVTSSVSISNSDDSYTVLADFDNRAAADVKKLITDLVGNPGKTSGAVSTWALNEVYTIVLNAKRLTIDLDKQKASGALIQSFVRLGRDIQRTVSRAGRGADEINQ